MKPRAFVDMDGVCYDWCSAAAAILGVDCTDSEYRPVFREYEDALDRLVGRDKVRQGINQAGYSFWENLRLFPWAHQLHDRLSASADVCFLSSYGGWVEAPKGKILALRRDFPNTPVLFGRKKYFCASERTILIDDKFANVESFREAGGLAVQWPNQYVLEDDGIDARHIIDEIVNLLNRI